MPSVIDDSEEDIKIESYHKEFSTDYIERINL